MFSKAARRGVLGIFALLLSAVGIYYAIAAISPRSTTTYPQPPAASDPSFLTSTSTPPDLAATPKPEREILDEDHNTTQLGSIRVRVRQHASNLPIPGIRIALLPPSDQGATPWPVEIHSDTIRDALHAASGHRTRPAFHTPRWRNYTWLRTTGNDGDVVFPGLPPGSGYRLQVQGKGLFEFEAKSTPIQSYPDGGTAVSLDTSTTSTELARREVSGRIPVVAGQQTRTSLRRYVAAYITANCPSGKWDHSLLLLNRKARSVIWTEDSATNFSKFRSRSLVPGVVHVVEGHFARGKHRYFSQQRVTLEPGETRDLGALPLFDPGSVRTLRSELRTTTNQPLPEPLKKRIGQPSLWIFVRDEASGFRTDVQLPAGQSLVLHGMRKPVVLAAEVDKSANKIPGWHYRDTTRGRDPNTGDLFAAMRFDEIPDLRTVQVTLKPPAGKRYSKLVYVSFYDSRDNLKIGGGLFQSSALTQACTIPVDRSVYAVIKSPGTTEELLGSRRTVRNLRFNDTLELADPGPPNGNGMVAN